MREVERVVDWILILIRWLIATSDRAAWILKTGWTGAAEMVVDRAAARWHWRRIDCKSLARELPPLRSIGWMTYCLGQGWTSAPPGLLPALVSRAPNGVHGHIAAFMGTPPWGARRFAFHGAAGSIHNEHFLFCSECARGFAAPALGALGYSTDFSMPADAAGL
jgi:hypothetical protein